MRNLRLEAVLQEEVAAKMAPLETKEMLLKLAIDSRQRSRNDERAAWMRHEMVEVQRQLETEADAYVDVAEDIAAAAAAEDVVAVAAAAAKAVSPVERRSNFSGRRAALIFP